MHIQTIQLINVTKTVITTGKCNFGLKTQALGYACKCNLEMKTRFTSLQQVSETQIKYITKIHHYSLVL